MKTIFSALEKTFVAITFAEHGVLLTETPQDQETPLVGQVVKIKR
jgi:hypothetical protein